MLGKKSKEKMNDTTSQTMTKLVTQRKHKSKAIASKPEWIYIVGVAVVAVAVFSLSFLLKGEIRRNRSSFSSEDTIMDKSGDSKENDEDYENAIMRKVSAKVQPGWFTSNDTAILHIDAPKTVNEIPLFVKTVSTFAWPTKSNILKLNNSFPIFHWDLTQYASGGSSKRTKNRLSNEKLILPDCRLQMEPVFVLGSERDKGGMVGSKHDRAIVYTNVSISEFFRGTFQQNLYFYWTGELDYVESLLHLKSSIATEEQKSVGMSLWDFFHVIEPNLEFVDEVDENLDTTSSSKSENSTKKNTVRPMVWLSHPGVVAQTHYDTQHNIFLQVQGFKRFHLFPPAAELYLYPNIHRSFRQSQIHFESPKVIRSSSKDEIPVDDVFQLVSEEAVEAIEVTLGPGDVLYIPPFWQHRVESLTLSLSLSIVSPSEIEAAIAELFWLQVPFGGDLQRSRSIRIRSVITFIDALFELFQHDFGSSSSSPTDTEDNFKTMTKNLRHRFAQSLYHTRFAPLSRKLSTVTETPNLCPIKALDDTITANDETTIKLVEAAKEEMTLIEDARGNFVEAATHFVSSLQQLQTDEAIKRTILRDYLEQLVRWAAGPQLTGEVLLRCF